MSRLSYSCNLYVYPKAVQLYRIRLVVTPLSALFSLLLHTYFTLSYSLVTLTYSYIQLIGGTGYSCTLCSLRLELSVYMRSCFRDVSMSDSPTSIWSDIRSLDSRRVSERGSAATHPGMVARPRRRDPSSLVFALTPQRTYISVSRRVTLCISNLKVTHSIQGWGDRSLRFALSAVLASPVGFHRPCPASQARPTHSTKGF